MSGLCGWFGVGGERPSTANMEAASAVLRRFNGAAVKQAHHAWGCAIVTGSEDACSVYSSADILVAVFGRPRFIDPDLSKAAASCGAARAIAESRIRLGSRLPAALAGSFSIAVLDRADGQALVAVDRMASRPICYAAHNRTLLFASTLDALNKLVASTARISRQAIYDYLHFHVVPGPQTVYIGRHRLDAGCMLTWGGDRQSVERYWRMSFVENENRPFSELKADFLDRVRVSVAHAAGGASSVGSFLSGGTDSSTVAGMLAQVTGRPPRTYAIGFKVRGFDESGFARIAAKHFGTQHREYYLTPSDVADAIPRIAEVHDQPFGNASAVPTYYCAALAKEDGVEALLGGDGGDELFAGNSRYAIQQWYALYDGLPASVRKGVVEPALARLPRSGILGLLQRYVRTASRPVPERLDHYNLLERLGPSAVFTSEFLASIDRHGPRNQRSAVYEDVQARSLINRMLAFDLKYTLADNDLPKVSRACELAGIEARFPLLDERVVAFSASLAPRLKLKRTTLRYFFKKALRDFLPAEVITKKKHGFGLPFGTWLTTDRRLRELAFDNLSDLKGRGIVRESFVDELMARHLPAHAEYYGTMVWLLMMLERWLKQRSVTV